VTRLKLVQEFRKRGGFNPRARAGRDRTTWKKELDYISFNPRARAGRDRTTWKKELDYISFNPRARAGRDMNVAAG